MINIIGHTITLPKKISNKIAVQHMYCIHKQRIGQKCIAQILSLLRSVVVGVPGVFGLFTSLEQALCQPHRIRMNDKLMSELTTWCLLIKYITNRPIYTRNITPCSPIQISTYDACKTGIRAVFYSLYCICIFKIELLLQITPKETSL